MWGNRVALISIFGAAGDVTTSILTNFEIPLRLVSIRIIVFTYDCKSQQEAYSKF
ncbi:MAG: hypothetical protein OEW49_02490 [Nitrosopumilus sp.]|nr:hypothetical protein [Nitrosopumilus sp.]